MPQRPCARVLDLNVSRSRDILREQIEKAPGELRAELARALDRYDQDQ